MLTVVTGPPCGGKSTYIRERAKPGDLIIDMDRLALALTTEDAEHHVYPDHVTQVARAARRAAITAALAYSTRTSVWIIDTSPSPSAWVKYRAANAKVVKCDPGPAVVLARIAAERPPRIRGVALAYYAERAERGVRPNATRPRG